MKDKMSCGNCAIGRADLLGCKIKSKCRDFAKWERPTYLWLDILPSEPGWYWFEDHTFPKHPDISAVEIHNDGTMSLCGTEIYREVNKQKGRWQGPLTPNEEEGK